MKRRPKRRGAPHASKSSSHAAAVRAAGKRLAASGAPWSATAARLAMYDAGVSVSRLAPDDLATLEAIHHHAHATARRAGAPKRAARKAATKATRKVARKAPKKAARKAPKKTTKKAAKKAPRKRMAT